MACGEGWLPCPVAHLPRQETYDKRKINEINYLEIRIMKNCKNAGPVVEPERPIKAPEPTIIDVVALMGEQREILLKFEGDLYRLRITSKGRLIMTK